MTAKDLPFWHFFQQIEKELSYERWIAKYFLFIDAIFVQNVVAWEKDWHSFKNFCKVLLLQDHRHEDRFLQLLDEAIAAEKVRMHNYFQQAASKAEPGIKEHKEKKSEKEPQQPEEDKEVNKHKPRISRNNSTMPEPVDSKEEKKLFYHTPAGQGINEVRAAEEKINFLFTDEYFPVTRRQMIKGWQFLRYKEKSGLRDEIDIKATINKVARDGLFLEPVFRTDVRNREDVLIIYADCQGSMAPFHELTNRLVATARGEGGHPKAKVYYFQNCPLAYVYESSNFGKPVKLKESLLKANRNTTMAVVISDAGAARGNADEVRKEARLEKTKKFLAELNQRCNHTVWLNPMPAHRWNNTAAELISEEVFLMVPVLDGDSYNFQDTFRTILKQYVKKTKIVVR